MSTYELPYFGNLELGNLNEYYDVDIEFENHEVQLDLNFPDNKVSVERLNSIKSFISKLEEYDSKFKEYIKEEYADEESDIVKTYISHHLEEISKEELSGIINFNDTSITPQLQMLESFKLVRAGFYAESEEEFAILDYTIGRELTQYLIVMYVSEERELTYLTMES